MPAPNPQDPIKKTHFLYEIEGLRGLLAVWVFISHLMWGSGFVPEKVKGFWCLLFSGGSAVTVFICISGFVIFLLLDTKKDSYLEYLTRRFFRLYPLFILTALAGALLFTFHLGTLGGNYFGPNVFVRGPEYYVIQSWVYISNALMFHGFLPGLGPMVLNPPSWSISLEWQFYIIAPLLFFFFSRNWGITSCTLIAAALLKHHFYSEGILNVPGATYFDQIIPFLVGMVSYLTYKNFTLISNHALISLALLIFTSLSFFWNWHFVVSIFSHETAIPIPSNLALWIWGIVFLSIMQRIARPEQSFGILSSILIAAPLQLLGKLSYCIYLIHQIVIFIFLLMTGKWISSLNPRDAFWIEFFLLVPVTLLLSIAAHRFIELPGIQFGKYITNLPYFSHAR